MTDIRAELSDTYDAYADTPALEDIHIPALKALVKALGYLTQAAMMTRTTQVEVHCQLAMREVRKAMEKAGA